MPHLTLEHSGNLDAFDAPVLLLKLNRTLAASGHFREVEIKSRVVRQDCFLVGTQPERRAYVHARLALLQGRSAETKAELSQSLLRVLKDHWEGYAAQQLQLCVEIQEIERDSYARADVGS